MCFWGFWSVNWGWIFWTFVPFQIFPNNADSSISSEHAWSTLKSNPQHNPFSCTFATFWWFGEEKQFQFVVLPLHFYQKPAEKHFHGVAEKIHPLTVSIKKGVEKDKRRGTQGKSLKWLLCIQFKLNHPTSYAIFTHFSQNHPFGWYFLATHGKMPFDTINFSTQTLFPKELHNVAFRVRCLSTVIRFFCSLFWWFCPHRGCKHKRDSKNHVLCTHNNQKTSNEQSLSSWSLQKLS